ncbi:hypothetical protein [Pelomicrobium sp. G1]
MGFSESTAATADAVIVGVLLAIVSPLDVTEEYGLIEASGGHHPT